MHMNTLLANVHKDRLSLQRELTQVKYCDYIYADDTLYAIAHREIRVVELAAQKSAGFFQTQLKVLGLSMMPVKSENFLEMPQEIEGSIFRRGSHQATTTATSGGVSTRNTPSGEIIPAKECFPEGDGATSQEGYKQVPLSLPYTQVARMKVLGVIFDKEFLFSDQFKKVLDKARKRLAIIAHGDWNPEY